MRVVTELCARRALRETMPDDRTRPGQLRYYIRVTLDREIQHPTRPGKEIDLLDETQQREAADKHIGYPPEGLAKEATGTRNTS